MKKQKKVYYGKAVYGNEEISAVLKILKNKSLSLMDGDNVKLLEKRSLDYLEKIWPNG